jgi:transposase
LALRRALQDVYASGADGPELLAWWCRWAKRSRLQPFVKLAGSIKEHWQDITAFFLKADIRKDPSKPSMASSNSPSAVPAGFRNLNYLKAIAYWVAGKLTLNLLSLRST